MIAYTLRLKAELRVNNAISTGFGMQHILLVKSYALLIYDNLQLAFHIHVHMSAIYHLPILSKVWVVFPAKRSTKICYMSNAFLHAISCHWIPSIGGTAMSAAAQGNDSSSLWDSLAIRFLIFSSSACCFLHRQYILPSHQFDEPIVAHHS